MPREREHEAAAHAAAIVKGLGVELRIRDEMAREQKAVTERGDAGAPQERATAAKVCVACACARKAEQPTQQAEARAGDEHRREDRELVANHVSAVLVEDAVDGVLIVVAHEVELQMEEVADEKREEHERAAHRGWPEST